MLLQIIGLKRRTSQSEQYSTMVHRLLINCLTASRSASNEEEDVRKDHLSQLAVVNGNLRHLLVFLETYVEEARVMSQQFAQQSLILDISAFVHLREIGALQMLVELVNSLTKEFSMHNRKVNVDYEGDDMIEDLIEQTVVSLSHKVIYILDNMICSPLDISQEVTVKAHKLSDIAVEGIANGIHFFNVSAVETLFVDNIVSLQKKASF